MKLVAIKIFNDRFEAEIVKSKLDAHGIHSVIFADDAGGMRPYPLSYSYGVVLKVFEKDLERAKNLLE